MTTSLAQQLNALKLQQRDEVSMPARTRISFLFDAKQASNIDDQTLYYIALSGVKQLEPVLSLDAFMNDVLAQNSLTFYRGRETKDTLKVIDGQLDVLLKALAPHYLQQSALKVLEYLIRIYEVHIYHKHTLLVSFVPLFETVYFLRLIQCVNLKDDQVWGWLHQFAFQGVNIDKQTLTKCLARHNALVFTQVADFCLEIAGDLHIKFFGHFLTEVLKENLEQGVLFSILPLIAKALKQGESKDLKLASYFAITQVTSRRTLTAEYAAAFTRQVLQTISAKDRLEFDEDLKLKGLTVILFLCQYQHCIKFEDKDISLLQKISKLPKLLQTLSSQYDTSPLARALLEFPDSEIIKPWLQATLQGHLKTIYLVVSHQVHKGLSDTNTLEVREKLELIKQLQPQAFQQSIVFMLKQMQGDQLSREKILQLLQGETFVTKFGEKEFSVMQALGSKVRSSRDSALAQLSNPNFLGSLSQKETHLIKIVLLQMVDTGSNDEEAFILILDAINAIENLGDSEYECLAGVLTQTASKKVVYSSKVTSQIVKMCCQANAPSFQEQQAWLAITNSVPLNPNNEYSEFYTKEMVVSRLVEKPQKAIKFILSCFNQSYIDMLSVAKTVRKIGVACHKDLVLQTFVDQLFMPMLSLMKKKKLQYSQEILTALIDILAKENQANVKILSKVIGVSLFQKQQGGTINLNTVHKKVFDDVLKGDKSKYAELMIQMAVESKCEIKRLFAIMTLTQMHSKKTHVVTGNCQIRYQTMIGVILMLINDESRQVRAEATKLAEIVLEQQKSLDTQIDQIEVFQDTDKPSSAVKRPVKLTPMKSKSVSSLLSELLQVKSELMQDRSQLKLCLNKYSKPEVFEEILRTLLDYPTFGLKQKLLEVLSLVQKQANIFCLNLVQVLPKLFVQIEQRQDGEAVTYAVSLGHLIQKLQLNQTSAQKELMSSLTLPFVRFVIDRLEGKSAPVQEIIYKMFDLNLLHKEQCDSKYLKDIFKYYIRANMKFFASSPVLKHLLISRAAEMFKTEDFATALLRVNEEREQQSSQELELTLETLIQVVSNSSAKLLEASIVTLTSLVKTFSNEAEQAYLIELATQLAIGALPSKVDSGLATTVAHLTQKLWEHTTQVVAKILKSIPEGESDPFNQFMNDESDGDASMDDQIDLLPCLQALSSFVNLLTPIEYASNLGQLPLIAKLLSTVSNYVRKICIAKSSIQSKKSELKLQLFYLYQGVVQKILLNNKESENMALTTILVCYVDTCIHLVTKCQMSNILTLTSNTITMAGVAYAPISCFSLLKLASQSEIQISDSGALVVSEEESPALFIAQSILIQSFESQSNLSCLEELLFLLHNTNIQRKSDVASYLSRATESLFNDTKRTVCQQSTAILADLSTDEVRKFAYLTTLVLSQWLNGKDKNFTLPMAKVAGTDAPTQEVKQQLLNCFLSSHILKEQVNLLLQDNDGNNKMSLTRLIKQTQALQSALNALISMQIHVEIVMKVLDLPSQVLLKANSLQLLLEKVNTFQANWLQKAAKVVQTVFFDLITKSVALLEEHKSQPNESFCQLLLTLISRCSSMCLPKDLQTSCLKIVFQYHQGSLQLQSQTILTELTLMETFNFTVLDHFHTYLKHTLDGFAVKQQQFSDVYNKALLKSLICIVQVFLKYLTADQLEQVIKHSLRASARDSSEVDIILESIASEAPNSKKQVLQSTVNAFSIVEASLKASLCDSFEANTMLESIEAPNKVLQSTLNAHSTVDASLLVSSRYFSKLLTPIIRRLPQSYISENSSKFTVMFMQMFKLHVRTKEHEVTVAELIVESFNSFCLKLNEETLRPIIVSLTKWAAKKDNFKSERAYILIKVYNGVILTLKEFFLPCFSIYFENLTLEALQWTQKALYVGQQGKRTHTALESDVQAEKLLQQTFLLLQNNFKFDTNSLLTADVFEKLVEPICKCLDLTAMADFDKFIHVSAKTLILEMNERINNDNMWQKLNYSLLMKTRSSKVETRMAVLTIIEHLFDGMRERYLVILNDTIPFISELLEDEDERVEDSAKRIVTRIEQLTGESINEYLK